MIKRPCARFFKVSKSSECSVVLLMMGIFTVFREDLTFTTLTSSFLSVPLIVREKSETEGELPDRMLLVPDWNDFVQCLPSSSG